MKSQIDKQRIIVREKSKKNELHFERIEDRTKKENEKAKRKEKKE